MLQQYKRFDLFEESESPSGQPVIVLFSSPQSGQHNKNIFNEGKIVIENGDLVDNLVSGDFGHLRRKIRLNTLFFMEINICNIFLNFGRSPN